jgi:hypothetical protein
MSVKRAKWISLKKNATNTPLPIWDGIGGENHQSFFLFLYKIPIDKPASMWYNNSGGRPGRLRRRRTEFPIAYPICEIFETSSDFSYTPDFSRKCRGPIGSPYATESSRI